MGQQSHDNTVLTALTVSTDAGSLPHAKASIQALNVVIRMEPTLKYPFNVRSFFTDRETKDIGSGLVLWRGYFQSVRPAIGSLLVNVDISTGTMYKAGSLMDLCLEYIGKPRQPQVLSPRAGIPEREILRLQRFISGIRIMTTYSGNRVRKTPRVVKKLSRAGAANLSFTMRDGTSMTVAQYFRSILNRPLQFPDNLCVEVSTLPVRSSSHDKVRLGWNWGAHPLGTVRGPSRANHAQASPAREDQGRPRICYQETS